jgi:hypothetical protein
MKFRKRISLGKGVKINLSKSGVSTTFGVKGLSVNVGKKGTYLNTGLSGTGIYDRKKISLKGNSNKPTKKDFSAKDILNTTNNEYTNELPNDEIKNYKPYNIFIKIVLVFLDVLLIVFGTLILFIGITDKQLRPAIFLGIFLLSLGALIIASLGRNNRLAKMKSVFEANQSE